MPYRAWENITDGTDQNDRFPAPLQTGYFLPDERSFTDLLSISAKFAAQLHFYDLANQRNGTWQDLFLCDDTMVMATMLATDTRALEGAFRHLVLTRQPSAQAALIFDLAVSIDTWYRRLHDQATAPSRGLCRHIATTIENGLATELHSLGGLVAELPPAGDLPDFSRFHEIWGIESEGGASAFPKVRQEGGQGVRDTQRLLTGCFRSFINAISYLKKRAGSFFTESLSGGRHDPAIGLFLAFVQLLQKAQQKLNAFTERHRDFYYTKMLGFLPRHGKMDSTYLILHPDCSGREIMIAAGARFSAGKGGDGEEVFYCADGDTLLGDAQVRRLCTLHMARDPLISPERELGYVTGAYRGEIPVLDDPTRASEAWPLFGKAGSVAQRRSMRPARLGFAVSSPVLFMAEGTREVVVIIQLAPEQDGAGEPGGADRGESRFGRLFSRYLLSDGEEPPGQGGGGEDLRRAAGLSPLRDASQRVVEDLLRQNRRDLFFSKFHKAFSISLTTASGWHEVSNAVITRSGGARTGLRFSFTLGPEVPPVLPSDPAVHGDCCDPGVPTARFTINPQASFYPYSFFSGFTIAEVRIGVSVRGVNDLVLHNNQGELDPSKPFYPFGPLPAGNSYLVLGSHEMAGKRVGRVAINLEWGDLPRCPGGFASHYSGYDGGYRNGDFTVAASVLRDGQWLPVTADERGRGEARLFETESELSPLSTESRIELKVFSQFKPGKRGSDDFRYDQRTRNGFFRLALTGEGGFGHREYTTLLTRTLTANATRKGKRRPLPLPNPPYTPVVSGISLDYQARAVINPSVAAKGEALDGDAKIFHLHPFGTELVYPSGPKLIRLLPDAGYGGNLFIALSSRAPGGSVTLFFHLKEDSSRTALGTPPRIGWFYLSGNRWRMLEQSQIRSDSTEGFLSSGIVTLLLPEDIGTGNTVMPEGYLWLRLSADGELSSFCSVYSVQAQALRVTRCPPGREQGGAGTTLAPGSIREAVPSTPGLEKVTQPVQSFQGEGRETEQQLVIRASERLRHRQRAVLPWDYERLILHHFPQVLKVKCFANLRSAVSYRPSPGSLLIVVVPRLKLGDSQLNLRPQLNAVDLSRVRALVTGLASPFVEVEVRNPAYELIRVVCSVKLKQWAEPQRGRYLEMLNQAVVDFISPWSGIGYQARFGWCIRRADIESYLLEQDYVELVTGFSLLHVVEEEEESYAMSDTARLRKAGAGAGVSFTDEVCPRHRWSLAIPSAIHTISAMDRAEALEPERTGLNQLQIGQTFIIGA